MDAQFCYRCMTGYFTREEFWRFYMDADVEQRERCLICEIRGACRDE